MKSRILGVAVLAALAFSPAYAVDDAVVAEPAAPQTISQAAAAEVIADPAVKESVAAAADSVKEAADAAKEKIPELGDVLKVALADLIAVTKDVAKAGVIFLKQEIPDVVKQLLAWHFTLALIKFVFAFVWMAAFIVIAVKLCNVGFKEGGSSAEAAVGFTILGGIVSSIVFFVCVNLDWLQIWIAPKVYLIEYAAELAKGAH